MSSDTVPSPDDVGMVSAVPSTAETNKDVTNSVALKVEVDSPTFDEASAPSSPPQNVGSTIVIPPVGGGNGEAAAGGDDMMVVVLDCGGVELDPATYALSDGEDDLAASTIAEEEELESSVPTQTLPTAAVTLMNPLSPLSPDQTQSGGSPSDGASLLTSSGIRRSAFKFGRLPTESSEPASPSPSHRGCVVVPSLPQGEVPEGSTSPSVETDLDSFEAQFKHSMMRKSMRFVNHTATPSAPLATSPLANEQPTEISDESPTERQFMRSNTVANITTPEKRSESTSPRGMVRSSSGKLDEPDGMGGSPDEPGKLGKHDRSMSLQVNGHKKDSEDGKKRKFALPSTYSFEKLLELPCCKNLKAAVTRVFKDFEKATKGNRDEEANTVLCLINDLQGEMKKLDPWMDLPQNHFLLAKEEMVKYVFGKLYHIIFVKKDYQSKDHTLRQHLDKIRPYVTPFFLDMREDIVKDEVIPTAIGILSEIDVFQTPSEKLACIFQACRVLSFVLTSGGCEGSADDLLPLLIFVVVNTPIKSLYSNMRFIERYVDEEEKCSESYCFFIHLSSAVAFLEDKTVSSITKAIEEKKEIEKQKKEKKSEEDKKKKQVMLAGEAAIESAVVTPTATSPTAPKTAVSSVSAVDVSDSTPDIPPEVILSSSPSDKPAEPIPQQPASNVEPQSAARTNPQTAPECTSTESTATSSPVSGDTVVPTASGTAAVPVSSASLPPAAAVAAAVSASVAEVKPEGKHERNKSFDALRFNRVFVDSLSFLDKDAAYFQSNPDEIAKLLQEYKKLAIIADQALPKIVKGQSWHPNPTIKSTVLSLPNKSEVSALLTTSIHVWVGFKNGRMLVFNTGNFTITANLQIHRSGVTKIFQVGNTVWCGTGSGKIYIVEMSTMQIQKKSLSLHDRRHSVIVDIVYDLENKNVWTAAIPDQSRMSRSTQLDTQLSVVPATSTTPERSLILHGIVDQISLFDKKLWVLLTGGNVVAYDMKTLAYVGRIGPFPSANPLSFSWMAVPCAKHLWIASGRKLQIVHDIPQHESPTPVSIVPGGSVLGICEASCFAVHPKPSEEENSSEENGTLPWSNLVACILDNGSIEIYDSECTDSPCVVLNGAPQKPIAMAISPSTTSTSSHLAVATETAVFVWSLS